MKDWKQVLMGLCKVKSIVTLLLTGTFMALALRGDVAAKDFYSVMVMVLTFYFGYQSAKAEDKGGAQGSRYGWSWRTGQITVCGAGRSSGS